MTVILNNDTQNEFEISELTYDYIKNDCFIRNHDITAWNGTVSTYLTGLQNTPITSIQLKDGNSVVRSYTNLNASVSNLREVFQQYESGPSIAFELGIKIA